MKKVYVIGHKSPDLDSVAGAISYANLKNKLERTNKYIPAVAGDINKETKYLLDKLGFSKPKKLKSVQGKIIILIDHNEASQAIDDIEKAEIIEVLDHHKINFKYNKPIIFQVFPWGATISIIANYYFQNNIKITKKMASLMLGALLVDTVITKSPTCVPKDLEIIKKLSKIGQIKNWKNYGMDIFKIRSKISQLSPREIIKSDFKDFNFKKGKIGIGQVETVDLNEIKKLYNSLLIDLEQLKKSSNYHSVILFITDIIAEGSQFLVATKDQKMIEKALDTKLNNNKVYLEKIISRKKQVVPKFSKIFDK